jgi:hypothetical protein
VNRTFSVFRERAKMKRYGSTTSILSRGMSRLRTIFTIVAIAAGYYGFRHYEPIPRVVGTLGAGLVAWRCFNLAKQVLQGAGCMCVCLLVLLGSCFNKK